MEGQLIPQQIPYEIEKLLGEGSNSTVFLASRKDRGSDVRHQVALKIPKSKNWVAHWEKELLSLRAVDSPYCVRLLGWEKFSGRTALVLEFVDGVSLRQLIAAKCLGEAIGVEIARQVQCGLMDLKSSGLCHGDLNPANILINTKGQVKLVDFGLANSGPDICQFTPEYAAPEVLVGEAASYEGDLFSLGQILAESFGNKSIWKSLCGAEPQNRKSLILEPDQQAKKELASIVGELLSQQQGSTPATRKVFSPPVKEKVVSGIKWQLLLLLAFGILPSSHSMESGAKPGSLAQLSIRTKLWTQIYIDKRYLGFTPIEKYLLPAGSYNLRWRQHQRKGDATIFLKKGEHQVLVDEFFEK